MLIGAVQLDGETTTSNPCPASTGVDYHHPHCQRMPFGMQASMPGPKPYPPWSLDTPGASLIGLVMYA